MDLNTTTPIDFKTPLHHICGNINLFYMMLGRLERMSLHLNMINMASAVEKRDFNLMKSLAITIRGASGYVGASRVYYACYFIEQAFSEKDQGLMIERYPRLVETVIEIKRYSR